MNNDNNDDWDPNLVCYTAGEVLKKGLVLAGVDEQSIQRRKHQTNVKTFVDRYGTTHIVCAAIWEDLQVTTIANAYLPVSERGGFDYFLMALHFLKRYDVESERALTYKRHRDTVRDRSWYFIERIQALKEEKIRWPEDNNDTWIMTVDGVHCWCYEPKHPEFSMDTKYYSHKYNKAGLNYELGVSISESRLIWMKGPFPAGTNDKTVFREHGLCDRLRHVGKKAIVDGGYYAADLLDVLSPPNASDSPRVKKFKRRAQRRHEVFNGMIKSFECLSQRFRHGEAKFASCFEACCVIMQYQMENGSPLYKVYVTGM